MKMREIATIACTLILFTGCGVTRFINPPQKCHEDPNFQSDPTFGTQPANYVRHKKTVQQIAEEAPTVYLEVNSNAGNWFGIGSDDKMTASGIVINYNQRPYILSAGHIVLAWTTEIKSVYVYFADNHASPEEVEIVAYDPLLDFSLLRFKNEKFRLDKNYPIIGCSADLRTGQKLVSVGSPIGIRNSVSDGMVMNVAVGRHNFPMPQPQLIVHNVTGNPGISGAPMFNEYGEVVGIFTGALVGPPLPVQYAVPIDDVARVLRRLNEPGKIKHAEIPLQVRNTWEWSREDYNYNQIDPPKKNGVFVLKDNAPHENKIEWHGLLKGDLILEANGVVISDAMQFWKYLLLDCVPGQTVEFRVERRGTEMTIEVKLK